MQEELWKNQYVLLLTSGGPKPDGEGKTSRRSGGLYFDPSMPREIGPPSGDGSTRGEVTFTPLDLKESIWSGLILRLMVTMCINYWWWMKNKYHSGYITTFTNFLIFFWSFHRLIPLVRVEPFQKNIWKRPSINLMLTTGMHILKHLNFNELGFGWSSLYWSNIQNIKPLSIIQKTAGPWHVPFSNQMQLREIATNVCLKLYSPYTVYNSVSLALFPFKWKVIYFRVDPLEVRNDFTFLLKAPKCLVLDTSTFNFQHNTIKRQCDLILHWKVTAGQMADLDKVLDFFSELQCCCVFGGISRKIIRNAGFCFEQEISRKRHER